MPLHMHSLRKASIAACFMLACQACPAAELTVPLEIVNGEGCVYDARSARAIERVLCPNAQGIVVIEAESPLRHVCRPSVRHMGAPAPKDAAASGGAYMDALVYARYAFASPKAQDLVVWARASADKGRWRFWEYLNGLHVGMFEDMEVKSKPTSWRWIKRGVRPAKKGWNWFDVIEYGYRFPKVDKWVLAPEGYTPTGLGPMPVAQANADAWLETGDVQVPGQKRLLSLEGLVAGVKVSISTDSGKTWQALAPEHTRRDGAIDLSTLAPDDQAVRFKLEFSSGQSIGPLRLKTQVDAERCVKLTHADTRLVIDATTGGLFLIENTRTGDAVVAPGKARPLVAVDFKKSGEAKWVRVGPESVQPRIAQPNPRRKGYWIEKPQEGASAPTLPEKTTATGNTFTATYRFDQPGLGRARVTCALAPGDEGTWRFAVKTDVLEGPADVTAVVFPIFERVRIGASGLDDHQLRLQSFGHTRIMPGKAPIRDTRYLGGCVMAWTEVYDDHTGFYVGAHDPQARNVLFTSKAGGRLADHFSMATEKRHQIKPGETAEYEYAVAAHPGPWRWGADRYRSWFNRTFGVAQYPKWMRTFDGWLSLQAENYGKSFRFDQLGDWLTRARAVGFDWVQVWGQFAYDGGPCCSAFYAPSPMYGGVAGWRKAVAGVKRRGGRVGGYFVFDRMTLLPLLSDYYLGHFKKSDYPASIPWPKGEFFHKFRLVRDPSNVVPSWPPPDDEIAKQMAAVKKHQQLYRDGKRAKSVHYWKSMWVDAPEWRDFMKFWIVDKYVREYGANTAYIDVLGCGGGVEDFDPRRRHNGYGTWGMGKMLIAKRVAQAARKVDPDFGLTMEGLGDLPALYAMPMCSGVYRGGRNVYRYTFPDRVLIHGATNPGSGGSAWTRYLETFVEGMRFDFVGRPTALPLLLLQHQRQFHPWIYQARFMDTVGLRVSDARVVARVHRLQGDAPTGVLVALANRLMMRGARVTLDTKRYGHVTAAFVARLDGKAGRLALQRGAGSVSFVAPETKASTVLLVHEQGRGPAVWPVVYLRRYAPPGLEVTLLNLAATRQTGACAVANLGFTEPFNAKRDEAKAALPFKKTGLTYSVGIGQAQTLRFPLKSLDDHRWSVNLRVQVQPANGPRIERPFLAVPLVLDGSFEFRGQQDEFVYHGARVLKLPPSDSGYQCQLPQLLLEPSHRYRVSVQAMRTGFKAKVHSTLLAVIGEGNTRRVWNRYVLDSKRPNEWQKLGGKFETPPDMVRAGLYLYNVMSPDTAWFDDLRVEDLGPVR